MSVEPPRLFSGGITMTLDFPINADAFSKNKFLSVVSCFIGRYPGMLVIFTLAPTANAPDLKHLSMMLEFFSTALGVEDLTRHSS